MQDTLKHLNQRDFPSMRRKSVETLQVNVGWLCNQQCVHCHVNASPHRKEQMTLETVELVLQVLRKREIQTLDITGGAPELNPHFRYLAAESTALGRHVIDRCNLTILKEPGQEDLAEFLASHQIEIIASMPCYLEENVDSQRGDGVFAKSIEALQDLNALGYGREGSHLILNLVYNPQGPTLPPPQEALEQNYKRVLSERDGITFHQLLTLSNMPIRRFGSMLLSRGEFEGYMTLLQQSHRRENMENVMCRTLLSVDWRGYLYDCDFNQMLDLHMSAGGSSRQMHLSDLLSEVELEGRPIQVRDHCYGCTAGQGSSCGGALNASA